MEQSSSWLFEHFEEAQDAIAKCPPRRQWCQSWGLRCSDEYHVAHMMTELMLVRPACSLLDLSYCFSYAFTFKNDGWVLWVVKPFQDGLKDFQGIVGSPIQVATQIYTFYTNVAGYSMISLLSILKLCHRLLECTHLALLDCPSQNNINKQDKKRPEFLLKPDSLFPASVNAPMKYLQTNHTKLHGCDMDIELHQHTIMYRFSTFVCLCILLWIDQGAKRRSTSYSSSLHQTLYRTGNKLLHGGWGAHPTAPEVILFRAVIRHPCWELQLHLQDALHRSHASGVETVTALCCHRTQPLEMLIDVHEWFNVQ